MKRLLILFFLAPLPVVAAPKCQWVSETTPEAVIQIGEVSPIGILSADLAWKGKVIRSLLMGQPNGYGSRWWAYDSKDGKPLVVVVFCPSEAINRPEGQIQRT